MKASRQQGTASCALPTDGSVPLRRFPPLLPPYLLPGSTPQQDIQSVLDPMCGCPKQRVPRWRGGQGTPGPQDFWFAEQTSMAGLNPASEPGTLPSPLRGAHALCRAEPLPLSWPVC